MKKFTDLEIILNGVVHMIDVTINGDGTLHYDAVTKDNGIDNCDPTPLTPEIDEAVREKLAEDIEAITEDYRGELSSCRTTKGLSYSLNH